MLTNYIRFVGCLSPDGGTGRRAGFKIQFWQQSVGSIPTLGTTNMLCKTTKNRENMIWHISKCHLSGRSFLTAKEKTLAH